MFILHLVLIKVRGVSMFNKVRRGYAESINITNKHNPSYKFISKFSYVPMHFAKYIKHHKILYFG